MKQHSIRYIFIKFNTLYFQIDITKLQNPKYWIGALRLGFKIFIV